jgi:uncharacterized membrane protein
MSREQRLTLLGVSCIVASVTMATANDPLPSLVRIPLGLFMVFGGPGFALICAVFRERQFSRGELLLASVGASIAITICAAVFLAAIPIGLSRLSLAIALGGCTLILSASAIWRIWMRHDPRHARGGVSRGIGP